MYDRVLFRLKISRALVVSRIRIDAYRYYRLRQSDLYEA
jgi:hypothetical protein